MFLNLLKDFWLLFGRMFPLPTTPGLREAGKPTRSSPVLVTCNFDLTVRKVLRTLERSGIDAWLLVAPSRGINVWCASGAGHFTADTVISILKTSGIAGRVDHRKLILPQLSGAGVNIWSIEERTGWKARFGPLRIEDLAGYLERGKHRAEPSERRVKFDFTDRLVMGTNLGFSSLVFFILPILIASIWLGSFWWKSIVLIFVLAVLNSLLVFRLPGKPGAARGLSLGIGAAALFLAVSWLVGGPPAGASFAWAGWILFVATYLGYDLPSWSPLWRADRKELLLGKRHTRIEIVEEKCIGCHLCDVVCPVGVFRRNPKTRRYFVADAGACQACGACVENCPTEAIATNFRSAVCKCPTCAVINRVNALKEERTDENESVGGDIAPESACCKGDGAASPESTTAEPAPRACDCGPSRGEHR